MAVYTTIDNPELYFQTELYGGTGSGHSPTWNGDTDMQPDIVWIKSRAATSNQFLYDSVRGATKEIYVNIDNIESAQSTGLTSFNSDGFTLGDSGDLNNSGGSFVAWGWKESATAGLDIVSYTGNSSTRTISHGNGTVPHMMIFKNYTGTGQGWSTYHQAVGNTKHLFLSGNPAASAASSDMFNNTSPTASVFTLNTDGHSNNNTWNYIGYIFSPIQGYSKFGSYEGNGNADGTFVYTGFRPAFIITKSMDSTSSWEIFDNKREGYNVDNDALVADDITVEATADQIDILSNGFKCRIATDPNVAETYIYMAFAEAPFVNSNGVPCNAR